MKDIIVAIPSKGRLREGAVDLMAHAGINARTGGGASKVDPDSRIRFLEMRPRDAAAWLQSGKLAAAFISTDTALEAGVADYPSIPLGFSASDLVLACRDDSGFATAADLAGKTIAESGIRRKTACTLIAIEETGTTRINPDPTQPLPTNAEIILIGSAESKSSFLSKFVSD